MKGFKRYERYKDSGVEWIGEIPEKWEVKPLKRITCFISRGITPTYVDDSSVKVINQACIYWEKLNLDNIKYQKEDSKILKGRLYKGDLIINSTGTGTLGRAAIFNLEGSYIADTHVTIIRSDKESLNNKYLFYLLQTPKYQGYIYSALVTGATNQIELSREGLSKTSIIYPKIEEQQAIAYFLDQKTAEIDFLIADKERLIELLQEQRQAIITQAVTKGLDPNVPMKDSGIEWIGEIPEHWEVLKLKYVVTLKSGKNITSDLITDDGEYPVYGGNGLRGYTSNFTHSGDYVLIGRQGALCGNISYAKGRFWASEHAVVVESLHHMEIFWIGELLRSMNLNQYSISAAQPGLAVERIKNLYIPVPPYDEQKLITDTIKPNVSRINNIIVLIKEQISKLKEYRQSLITAAVTGKIDVRNYNIESDQVEGEEQEEVS